MDQIVAAARRPVGTLKLGGATYPRLRDPTVKDGNLAQIVAGAHVFRLAREDKERLSAYHSSPGSGTWVASIELADLPAAERLDFWLSWSPSSLRLIVVDPASPADTAQAEGGPAPKALWVAEDGAVVEAGSPGASVAGVRVYASGRELVSPPAIELWRDTLLAFGVLISAESKEGYIFEVVSANAALGMLVTGFETYCERRFLELELEGITPDVQAVLKRVGTKEERDLLTHGQTPRVIADAAEAGQSALRAVSRRINFQDFDTCKRVYKRAYGVKFGSDLGVSSQLIERVRRLLSYRHRIVHVSPLIGLLNQPNVPPEDPEFSNHAFARSAASEMGEFVESLHAATLRLGLDAAE
jgi:hypothetical protein